MFENTVEKLISQYKGTMEIIGGSDNDVVKDIYSNIRIILRKFMTTHKRVAIYCYGYHTRMLLTDFVAELRDLVCVIDNGIEKKDGEFKIIKDGDIEKYEIDGIIISSYKHMNEIKRGLYRKHASVDVLDIYDSLRQYGINLEHDFFCAGPYQVYSRINTLNHLIAENESRNLLDMLLSEYMGIKDFRLAKEIAKKIYMYSKSERDKRILKAISELYEMEMKELSCAGEGNILLLCLDGMRRADFYGKKMEKVYALLKDSSYIYTNAYSYSTMTYESLVPVFEENTDQKTEYYMREEVSSADCRFIKKALEENRFIAIYGDGNHYIYDDSIKYSGSSQTITEKLWDFVIDISGNNDGIFYLHELYESHYSFANPYTKKPIVSRGSAMLFDMLPENKGYLETDYQGQQKDALRYLDDTLAPFIEVLPCNMVLFADHGNLILDQKIGITDIKEYQLHAAEDWIKIPLVVKRKGGRYDKDDDLISLMSLNDIIISIMDGVDFEHKTVEYVKIGRSCIYNQQFKELYRLMSSEYRGEAFEGFIFNDGYKLLIFSNNVKKLYNLNDEQLTDNYKIDELFEMIKAEVTIL